jgi:hypothetical protein
LNIKEIHMNCYRVYFVFLIAFVCHSCVKKEAAAEPAKGGTLLKSPRDYFPKGRAQVLVVGTFHFNYPNLDAIKAADEDKIDVLEEPKKSEVTDLVHYIEKFRPTKIAIEAYENWDATRKLREYKEGKYRDQRDERFQLAMRIATDMQLDTLYAVDALTMADTLEIIDSTYTKALFKDYDFKSDDPLGKFTFDWITEENKMVSKVNLKEYLAHRNSRESHNYGYGAYLVGDFKLGEYRGADVLSSWWYNRNLRIFRNIQGMTDGPGDRILLIIGNGHAAILRQLFECSPEYDFVEFDSL